jgi:hypothetical protein
MKTSSIQIACALITLGISATAPAASVIDITLSDAGSNQTAISWTWSGDIVGAGAIVRPGIGAYAGFGATIGDFVNHIDSNPGYITLALDNWGTLTDLDNSNSKAFEGIQFQFYDSPDLFHFWVGTYQSAGQPYTSLSVSEGDRIQYTPGATSAAVIDIPFSSFNPGTYSTTNPGGVTGVFTTDLTYNMNVVPEPTTSALCSLGGLFVFSRRRKSAMA